MIGQLTEIQLDLLREVSNIGSGHAATALSQLLGRRILLNVPRVQVLPISDVPDVVGGPETPVAGLFFRIFGQAAGSILILLPQDSALSLVQDILKQKVSAVPSLQEMEASALKEVGNILAGSYLNAIGQMLHLVLIPSIPGLALDMAGAVLDTMLIELSREGETALLIETEFLSESTITGHFFLLPDPDSLDLILTILQRP